MDRCARVRTCGVDRHAYICSCGVNRRAFVCTCGLNNCTLEARLTGVKLIFFMFFVIHVADLGLCYVVAGNHCARCQFFDESRIGPN
jgi:hypothetical protein